MRQLGITLAHGFIAMLAWVLWLAVALGVLGGAAYLFIRTHVTDPAPRHYATALVAYRELSRDDTVRLTGSITVPDECHVVEVFPTGTLMKRHLSFNIIRESGCIPQYHNLQRSFYVSFTATDITDVTADINGQSAELIIK